MLREWISVRSELPACFQDVLVAHKYGVTMAYINDYGEWRSARGNNVIKTVTHWMPLPNKPKED